MKFLRILFFLCLLSLLSNCNFIRSVTKMDRAEKIEQQMEKEGLKVREDAKKKHFEMQSERSKEMMKKTKKRSRVINNKKKEPFWKKLLGL